MTKKKAIRESILHYERMIDWAGGWAKLHPHKWENAREFSIYMYRELKESPQSESCAICGKYKTRCSFCIIGKKVGATGCDKTPWMNIVRATSLDKFIKALQQEKQFLIDLFNEQKPWWKIFSK